MTRITVLGGTGYAGAQIVAEAARRGHDVTSISRTLPADRVDGVTYRTASVLDRDQLASSVRETDVVFETLSPRGELAGRLEGVVDELVTLLQATGTRLGVLGGASSLTATEGGPMLFDLHRDAMPPEVLPEVQTGIDILDRLRAAPTDLDWFYVSPAQDFGAWEPGEATGRYRVSDDVLLTDEQGRSFISAADLAVAVLDEIENPTHRRARFHVAY